MRRFAERFQTVTQTRLILGMGLLFTLFYNIRFFRNLLAAYPPEPRYLPFLISLALLLYCAIVLQLALLCWRYTAKPVLIVLLLLSSLCGYFMDSYNVIIDSGMLTNVAQTDFAEALDLLSLRMIGYLVVLGLVPAFYVYRVKIRSVGGKKELFARGKLLLLTFAIVLVTLVPFGSYYASFFREHKPLRFYTNPSGYLYGAIRYALSLAPQKQHRTKSIGLDAKVPVSDSDRELIVFVVGETARADRFSLNGYERTTNPLLESEEVYSFTDFWSCGTSTAVSVPCMFSVYDAASYSKGKAQDTENLLDVLIHAGVNVIWLDNNSDSKGVATRVPYQSYKTPELNTDCDQECRDTGMLSHLAEYIENHPQGDIFIVLHQMGTHGPAYYKRYPPSFEKFTPVCHSNQLEECSTEEIGNAYDNTILYTDYFLSKTINLLKRYDDRFETAMFYVSDHGESLGENGIYLHGMPDFIAPDVQKKVPAIVWLGRHFDAAEKSTLRARKDHRYSHDNIFNTVLGMMEIETGLYNREMDIFHDGT